VPRWAALLGQTAVEEDLPADGVRVAFFSCGDSRIELVAPTSDDSPTARSLRRRGAGLHHICLSTPDLGAALKAAQERGLEVVPPGVRTGAGGTKVAFLHPRGADGTLVELRQAGDPKASEPKR